MVTPLLLSNTVANLKVSYHKTALTVRTFRNWKSALGLLSWASVVCLEALAVLALSPRGPLPAVPLLLPQLLTTQSLWSVLQEE